MYVKKTDSPANGTQIYVDGRRYRSIFEAASDTNLTYWNMAKKISDNKGAPCFVKKHKIVTEFWLLSHPEYLLEISRG